MVEQQFGSPLGIPDTPRPPLKEAAGFNLPASLPQAETQKTPTIIQSNPEQSLIAALTEELSSLQAKQPETRNLEYPSWQENLKPTENQAQLLAEYDLSKFSTLVKLMTRGFETQQYSKNLFQDFLSLVKESFNTSMLCVKVLNWLENHYGSLGFELKLSCLLLTLNTVFIFYNPIDNPSIDKNLAFDQSIFHIQNIINQEPLVYLKPIKHKITSKSEQKEPFWKKLKALLLPDELDAKQVHDERQQKKSVCSGFSTQASAFA